MHFLSNEDLQLWAPPMQRQTVGPFWTAADTHIDSSSGSSSPTPSASSYSSTSSPLPPSSYMLLSAPIQDEASGHVGISPNSGSRFESACWWRRWCSVHPCSFVIGSKQKPGSSQTFNLFCLGDRRSFSRLSFSVQLLKLCRKSEKLRLLLLSSIYQKMFSSRDYFQWKRKKSFDEIFSW